MQCVERGHFGLDDDVTVLLPELKGREILTGFHEETGEPILIPNTKTITLRYTSHSTNIRRTLTVWQTSVDTPERDELRCFQYVPHSLLLF